MQEWTCVDCGEQFDTAFKGFLHAFTTHMHQDIVLKPDVALALLKDMVLVTKEQLERRVR
jgi:hypothetical protein